MFLHTDNPNSISGQEKGVETGAAKVECGYGAQWTEHIYTHVYMHIYIYIYIH